MVKKMKKKLLSLTMGLCLSVLTAVPTMAQNYYTLRLGVGTYYDYLCIETTDGNEWLLGDDPESKYLDENGNAIFKDGESVIVLFDTMGTAEIEDDVILDVLDLN